MTASGPLYAAISAGTVTDTRVPVPESTRSCESKPRPSSVATRVSQHPRELSSTRMFLARPRFTTTTTMYVDVTC
ncbi:Uncharacterised protein [Mycobacteroides abscessus]|nr:Uncharacterised protein [Mycobacteroides abscessus]CPZ25554.1 Uncharacterised protein [Mycobacteroides abscessus]CPZ64373.1 Uncharacterised protein [Mycobacteroides abscessus]SIK43207.1 Uncharacterised protein [Mycobacteroides abscessus subsp. abscessus]SKM01712.1 Uncharacterised protein [Mycobacteroides abscessus subsp. massiliense]